jgi:NDP-sugar pyrophosphorylase family protein
MINIVIPMAGHGSRMAMSVPDRPKPLINVLPGQPMIAFVTHYLALSQPHRFFFVCRDEHVEALRLENLFASLVRSFLIVTTREVTEGPACTALLTREHIDNDQELLIAYCDDYLDVRVDDILAQWRKAQADAGVLLFPSRHPRNAYAITDPEGRVVRVAEKERISTQAVAGFYYFSRGCDFVRGAERMMHKNVRAKGEFFVSSVFNELIEEGKKVLSRRVPASRNFSMGHPADLEQFRRIIMSKRQPRGHVRRSESSAV